MNSLSDLWQGIRRNRVATICLVIVVAIGILSLVAPWMAPHDPLRSDLDSVRIGPCLRHPFGTDELGRDILSRVIYGARMSLAIAGAATCIAVIIGTLVGIIAGYVRGKTDLALVSVTDLTLAFPSLLLAIGITVVLGPSAYTVLLALALVGWAGFARLVRGLAMSISETDYIRAAVAAGCSRSRILIVHVLPNCLPLVIVAASLRFGAFILGESALSFLGLGLRPPMPSLGSMVSLGRVFMRTAPWMTLFPGAVIALLILCFNTIGDAVRDELDPRLRLGQHN
ncbi:MAG: ABC transporter permease [Candidatus Hydrogenedentes bacterium]|nr:ABC transporter permease [Candidatus Hydrogenedentota bacterium]